MTIEQFIQTLPKVELHVHLEGAIRPETLLKLARRHHVALPADSLEGLKQWYVFRDFPHFAEVYQTLSKCLRTVDDIELITRDFLRGQAEQNIRHTEATFTALTHYRNYGLPFDQQLAAINRAREWGERELNTSLLVILDIPREYAAPEEALQLVQWLAAEQPAGVAALGLGGYEVGFPVEKYQAAFELAYQTGLPAILHAGETAGPASIWSALQVGRSVRIGHGVRCLEDAALVQYLRDQQIPLEVCPSSNVCLRVVKDLASHPLPQLLAEGLYVTINTDDPPMFNTTLNEEFAKIVRQFGLTRDDLQQFVLNALCAARLPNERKLKLEKELIENFAQRA
ncbi:MAG: Aminodeoxyfutalosine deaminase [bacterium]|nr:Aminodeoxyfutalosine deaminase [bacterium]